jgi:hypothetical protein
MTVNGKKMEFLGRTASRLEAQKMAKKRGVLLASNVLHDDYLRTDRWKDIKPAYQASWAREILVHPAKGSRFRAGEDVVDSQTRWTVPGKYLTDPGFINGDAFMKGVGLFIDPRDIRSYRGRVVVIPASITLLCPFIQESDKMGNAGKADGATRIPLDLDSGNEQEMRWIYRMPGVGVRPIARFPYGVFFVNGGQFICGDCRPEYELGVAVESVDGPEDARQMAVRAAPGP